jgi:hypothetical protein
MTTGATKPDWDTPPDGDFAAYVERLTAQAPLQKARAAQASAAATNGAVQSSKASAPATSLPQVLPPDVLQLMQPLAGALRTV